MRAWIVLGTVLGLLVATTPAAAQLYSWTDENGVVHYTADPASIPPQYRPADLQPMPAPAPMPSAAPTRGGWESWGVTPAPAPTATALTVQFTPGDPIVVPARLNGTPVTLLLDTGADRTMLSPAAVERAGYAKMVVSGSTSVRILGVTGSALASVVTVPLLDVGGARIGPLSLLVHDAGLGGLDGLLGRDVLDAFTVTIDAAAGRATLTPR
jgi:hypothetical protein